MSGTAPELSQAQSADAGERRLHPVSVLFLTASLLRHTALPLLAGLALGHSSPQWQRWALLGALVAVLVTAVKTWRYRYEIQGQELVIREGVISREVRHVPFARIHNSSQRRNLFHRLFGVTELRLESAAGGKPEAVMKVLSLRAAADLEARIRAVPQAAAATADVAAAAEPPALDSAPRVWLQLDWREILRLGLISNRGMVVVGVLWGTLMSKDFTRRWVFSAIQGPWHALRHMATTQLQMAGPWLVALEVGVLVLMGLVLVRLLSVLLAFFRYHGYRLEQQGEKLVQTRGLSTRVTASARLPRLQRWVLRETLLHRLFGRCQLSVTVAGESDAHDHGLEAGGHFDELAPVARPELAQAMLQRCVPGLNWDELAWQPFAPQALARRWIGAARWILPLFALLGFGAWQGLWTAPLLPSLVALVLILSLSWWHARLWLRFGAWAEQGDLLLYRHGVFTRRWEIVVGARLQQLSLYSSSLDRSLGLCHLRADTQGAKSLGRALDIPFLRQADADRLRQRLWQRVQVPY